MTITTMPQQPKRVAQPTAQSPMVAIPLQEGAQQQQREPEVEQTVDGRPEHLNLRGGCPGRFCGLPILPCRCDICIIPIPCC